MSSNLDKDLLSGMLLYLTGGILFSLVFLIAGIYFNYQLNEEYSSILSLDKPHLIAGYSGSLNKTIDLKVLKSVSDLSNKYSRDKLEFYLKDGLIYGFRCVLDNEHVIVLVPSKPVLFSTFEFDLRPICGSTECLVKLESIPTNKSHNIKYTHGNLSLNGQTIPVTVVENYSNMYTSALYNAVRMLGGVEDPYLYIGTHIDEFLNSYTANKGNSKNPAITIIIYMFSKEPRDIPSHTHIIERFKNDLVMQLRIYNVNYVAVDLVTTSLKASLERIGSTIVHVEMILIIISLFVLMGAFILFNKTYIPKSQGVYKSLVSSEYDIAKLLKRLHIAITVAFIFTITVIFVSYRIVSPLLDPNIKFEFYTQSTLLASIIGVYIVGIGLSLNRKLQQIRVTNNRYHEY